MDSGEEVHNRETAISRPDGQNIEVSKTTVAVDLEGRRHLIDIFVDISPHKRAVEEVRKAHREKELLIKSIPSILIGVTSEGLVSQCNPFSERVFGIRATEVMGRPFSLCGVQWDWPMVNEAVGDCLNRKASVSLEKVRFTGNDGKEGFLGLTFTPVEAHDADRPGFLVMGADITNSIMLELQLAQARKLEAIGQLAAGIAHEINTPTQYVGDNIRFFQEAFNDMKPLFEHYSVLPDRLLKEGVSEGILEEMRENILNGDIDYLLAEIPQALEQTLEGVERVSTIVRSMKEFSHPGAKEKTPVDINRAIENTVIVSRNEWKYVAHLEMDLDPLLPQVSCLPAEMNQVILNMITNAAHAIGDVVGDGGGEKGLIRISTRAKGNSVEIRISDTGTGIPEDIQTRVFDPFFTTKEVGKGADRAWRFPGRSSLINMVGLSHSKRKRERAHHLLFICRSNRNEPESELPKMTGVEIQKRRILFVDDEPRVIQGLRRMLHKMGRDWEMKFAQGGPEALVLLDLEPFDVIVSDMRMPGMDGAELLAEVQRRHPQMVRIVLSGLSSHEMILKAAGSAHQFLMKPCAPELLKRTVSRVCALQDLLDNEVLERIVSQTESLPSLPDLYCKLMEEIGTSEGSIQRVGEIIETDLSMSAKMVQLVSSAFLVCPDGFLALQKR